MHSTYIYPGETHQSPRATIKCKGAVIGSVSILALAEGRKEGRKDTKTATSIGHVHDYV